MSNETNWTAEVGKTLMLRCGGRMTVKKVAGDGSFIGDTEGSQNGIIWPPNGQFAGNLLLHPFDIVAEYHEPAPAGWITDRMPTEADETECYYFLVKMYGDAGEPVLRRAGAVNRGSWQAWLPIPKFTPPPPEKKKVPLSLGEIRTSWELRLGTSRTGILEIIDGPEVHIHLANGRVVDPAKLMEHGYEYSPAGGETWEPCYKEVD